MTYILIRYDENCGCCIERLFGLFVSRDAARIWAAAHSIEKYEIWPLLSSAM